jgi:small subunit ribosomal protein S14
MKLKTKLLRDISIRFKFNNIESCNRSLKVLIRLKVVNYLNILDSLSRLSKTSSFCRRKNRCFITSRSSGNFSKISLSRIKVRELANNGLILGFSKASW